MRTIKFRGYVPTYLGMKGYWVYGLLARYNDELATIVSNDKLYTVPSNTIGQFTGLHDKNGVEIYEGDKLLMKDEIGNSGVVTVGFEHGGFIVFRGLAWRQIGDYDVEKNTIEVIGNIHEEVEE